MDREELTSRLAEAFEKAVDVTPVPEGTPPHILLPTVALPPPWQPSPTRVLTVWADWPTTRPALYVDEQVVGEGGEPPRSNSANYLLGQTWRGFSYTFSWVGDDPVRAVQLWLGRFTLESS
jgi:hypothetical protein